MVRETRGAAAKEAPVVDSTPSNKRKRRTSDVPSAGDGAPAVPSLKVVLPSPSSVGAPGKTTTIHISPSKVNGIAGANGTSEHAEGSGEGSAKKQRISLKIGKANGTRGRSKSKSPALEEVVEDEKMDVEEPAAVEEEAAEEEVKEKKVVGRPLPIAMREALESVLSKMCATLPPPHTGLLRLPLPPSLQPPTDDKKAKPQTLESVLRNPDLTWEQLVGTLHTLSAVLLAPSRYPNPLPPLSQLTIPIPPLPSAYVPFPLYRFLESLRQILISIAPSLPPSESGDQGAVERWALLQKGVQHGPSGAIPVEWWSSLMNLQEAERTLQQLKQDGKEVPDGLLGHLAGLGGMFGNAIPVVIHDTIAGPSQRKGPTLNDSLIRKASHKAARWKEELAKRRKGGFGSVSIPVRGLKRPDTDFSWTPSFAPSYDSLYASGGSGYWNTVEGMHQRAIAREWRKRAFNVDEVERGWQGVLPATGDGEAVVGGVKGNGAPGSVDEILRETGEHLEELEAWQFDRLKRGVAKDIGDRENALADTVLTTLTSLASTSSPSALLGAPPSEGDAHTWSQRFINPIHPPVRGTLDPRRPKGIKDNTTARFNARPPSLPTAPPSIPQSSLSSSGGPRPYGPGTPGYSQATPNAAGGYRRPVGRPPSTPTGAAGAGYYAPPNPSNPFSRPAGAPFAGDTIYNRPGGAPSTPLNFNNLPGGPQQPLNALARPGAGVGPSGLRQSYPTPGAPGAGAGGMGMGRAYAQGGYSPMTATAGGMMSRPPMTPTMR